MVLLGEYAMSRGLPLSYFAFPTVGLPDYKPIAPPLAMPSTPAMLAVIEMLSAKPASAVVRCPVTFKR